MRPQSPQTEHTFRPASQPRAAQHPSAQTRHDVTLTDEYAWLKAANWQEVTRDPQRLDPTIRAYLQAENDYCDSAFADSAALEATLFAEMRGRIKDDDFTVPTLDGPHAYYSRYRKNGQHPLLCREPRELALSEGPQVGADRTQEQLLLDADALARGKPFFKLGATRHSPDHRLLAWSADEAGSELYTMRVRVIESGVELADAVPDCSGAVVWTQDAGSFYYVRLDRNHRPAGVFRHRLRSAVSADERVFAAPEPGLFLSIGRHVSGRYGDIAAHDHETSEVWLIDLAVPDAPPTLVAARETGVQYEVEHHPSFGGGPALIIRTNADGAEDFKIVWTPLATPGRQHWRDLVAHRPGVYILSFMLLEDWLVRLEREDGLPRIVVRRLDERRRTRHRLPGRGLFALHRRRLRVRDRPASLHLFVDDDAGRGLGLRPGDARAPAAQAPGSPERARSRRLRHAAADGADGGRRNRSHIALTPQGAHLRPHHAAAAVRLRRLWHLDPGGVRHQPTLAGRSRLRLCHRPCARRQRKRLALVSRRQARRQTEHLPRLHRSQRISDRAGFDGAWPHRRPWRLRRRHVDRRGRQHAAGPLRRHDCRGAVRRRAQHHARRGAAADAAGMAGMGQSDPRCRRVPDHPVVFAL